MHPSLEAILKHFKYDHLPENLQPISAPFCALAKVMAEDLPPGPEVTVCLLKLLEAKDCAVRAVVREGGTEIARWRAGDIKPKKKELQELWEVAVDAGRRLPFDAPAKKLQAAP